MMRGKAVALFALTVTLALAETPWRQSCFIIGACQDPCLSGTTDPAPADPARRAQRDGDRSSYQFCKNAYFNLLSGHNYLWDGSPCETPVLHGQEKTDYALHIAADAGLKSLVQHEPWESCNCRATFLSFMRTENTAPYKSRAHYAEYISGRYKNLGARPYAALQGYCVAAEPGPASSDVTCGSDGFTHGIDTLKMWVSSFKTCCPEKQSHVFIFPSGAIPGLFSDTTSYKSYIDTVFNDPDPLRRPQAVCSNAYPLFDPKLRPIEENFFWGLNTCRDKAGGRPFWNHTHCIFTYRDRDAGRNPELHTYIPPDEATLRWNAMVNVAHGVRGIIWFVYVGFNRNTGIYGNFGKGIVDCSNRSPFIAGSTPQRTEYEVIREINRYLACVAGPAVMASDFVNAYHRKISGPDRSGAFSVAPGQSFIPPGQILRHGADDPVLFDIGDKNAMAGVFRDRIDTAVFYLLVVNKNWALAARPVSGLSLTLKGDMRGRVLCGPRLYGYGGSTALTRLPAVFHADRRLSTVRLPDPLLSGEGRLIKVFVAGPPSPHEPGFRPRESEIAAAVNHIDKKIICFARGTDNRVYARIQDTADVDFWGQEWRLVSTTQTGGPIACANFGPSSPVVVASATTDGKLQYTFQSRPLDKNRPLLFDAWHTIPMKQKINSRITISCFGKCIKHLAFFFRCGDTLFYAYLDTAGACRGPCPLTSVDPHGNGSVAAGVNTHGTAKGSVDLFVTKPKGRLYRARITPDILLKRAALPFAPFTSEAVSGFTVARNADGSLEVFYADRDSRKISHKRQRSPGSAEWEPFDEQARVYGGFSAGINRDGQLELFYRDSAGYLCHLLQLSPAAPRLGPPARLGAGSTTISPSSPAAVACNGDGRLTVFAACEGNANVFYSSQGKEGCGIDWQNCLPFTNLSDQDR